MIERRVRNAFALDYPRDRLEVIVSSDGSTDATVERARGGRRRPGARPSARREGPRAGRRRVERARARSSRSRTRTRTGSRTPCARSSRRFADPRVGYVCGQLRFVDQTGKNMEGLYWRYELWIRSLESRLGGRDGRQRRDLRGPAGATTSSWTRAWGTTSRSRSTWSSAACRPVYEPRALATEKMVPTIEGEFARKRRMMGHGWLIVLRGGLLSPRGYGPLYALEIFSHRVLRYVVAVPAPDRARGQRRARRRGRALRGHARDPARAARGRARRGQDRALLRPDDGVARRGPVGLAAPRHAAPSGRRPRARGEQADRGARPRARRRR